jgi:hypothetical protein
MANSYKVPFGRIKFLSELIMSELKNLWEYMFYVQMKREESGCNPRIQAAEFHQKGVVFFDFFCVLNLALSRAFQPLFEHDCIQAAYTGALHWKYLPTISTSAPDH